MKTVFDAVRKSTREKRGGASEEKEAEDNEPPVSALVPTSLLNSEEELAKPVDATDAPSGQEVQPQVIQTVDDGLKGEEEDEEGLRRANIKGEENKSRLQRCPQ